MRRSFRRDQAVRLRGRGGDLDAAGLEGFRKFALERDGQKAVAEAGVRHHHIVGQLEVPLEVAGGQPPVQVGFGRVVGGLAALHGEQVRLGFHVQFLGLEARDRHLDPVGVLARRLDVVGRVAPRSIGLGRLLDQRGEMVEAHGGAIEGGEVDGTHVGILLKSKVASPPACVTGSAMSSTVRGPSGAAPICANPDDPALPQV